MRSILAALVLFLFAGRALAVGQIRSAAEQLTADVDARIAAIGTPTTKPLATELKNLKSASARLAKYSGEERVPDLKVLAGAGKFIALSRTEDPAITADIHALLQAFYDGAAFRKGRFEFYNEQLVDPQHVKLLAGLDAAATKAFEAGQELLAEDPVRAAAALLKAYDLFGNISAQAKGFVAFEDGSPLPDGLTIDTTGSTLTLRNAGTGAFVVQKIRVFAAIRDGVVPVKGYSGQSAAALIPKLFAAKGSNRIPAAALDGTPGTFDLLAILARLVPNGTASPNAAGELHIYLKGEGFVVVTFDVPLS
jgi:hypothetical protein